jgi:heat shock protein HspQ
MIRFAETDPVYEVGQVVRHRRYGYRGVIVAVDERCMADPAWYTCNQTQPDQNQPWYHLLVHGCATTTYAAECNLLLDETCEPIDHPLLAAFFCGCCHGKYVRNDRPWRGW